MERYSKVMAWAMSKNGLRELYENMKKDDEHMQRFIRMCEWEYKNELKHRVQRLGTPRLEFEISESGLTLDEVIEAVTAEYPTARFWGTESRYESCIMAIFEL